MIRAKTNIIIRNDDNFFGPGVATFFRLIDDMGSIRTAAQAMGMSYSKAWKLIKRTEAELGFSMLIRQIGGRDGGSSCLTEEGADFLKRYVALQKDAQDATDKLLSRYFPECV